MKPFGYINADKIKIDFVKSLIYLYNVHLIIIADILNIIVENFVKIPFSEKMTFASLIVKVLELLFMFLLLDLITPE